MLFSDPAGSWKSHMFTTKWKTENFCMTDNVLCMRSHLMIKVLSMLGKHMAPFSRQERKSRRSGQTQPRNMETNPKPWDKKPPNPPDMETHSKHWDMETIVHHETWEYILSHDTWKPYPYETWKPFLNHEMWKQILHYYTKKPILNHGTLKTKRYGNPS